MKDPHGFFFIKFLSCNGLKNSFRFGIRNKMKCKFYGIYIILNNAKKLGKNIMYNNLLSFNN